MFNLLSSDIYLSDTMEPISKWATIAIASAILIAYLGFLAVRLIASLCKNQELADKSLKGSKPFIKYSAICFFFYALVLGIFLLVLEILKKFDTAYLEENWVSLDVVKFVLVPLLTTLVIALIGAITIFVLTKKQSTLTKKITAVFGIILGVCIVVSLILIGIHFSTNVDGDGYYTGDDAKMNPLALYISAGALIILTVGLALFLGRNDKKPFDTRCIALAGICASLSFALSYIKLWDMPAGGSVTLVSLLPVMIFAYAYGTKKGLLVGFLYGVLQAVQDPWLIHPAQFLLDYPIAFSMVCLAGVMTDLKLLNKLPQVKFCISAIFAGTMRFLCHVLSGVFAFGAYAVDAGATNFWTFSLVYNSYVFIDVALVILAGFIVFSSKAFNKQIINLNPEKFDNN